MSQMNQVGSVLPQNTGPDDDADQPGIAQPVSQAEIEEFLYGTDRPATERLERLRQFRDELRTRESADFGDDDPKSLLAEIDEAISRLEFSTREGMAFDTIYHDPLSHSETFSPDSEEREDWEEENDADFIAERDRP